MVSLKKKKKEKIYVSVEIKKICYDIMVDSFKNLKSKADIKKQGGQVGDVDSGAGCACVGRWVYGKSGLSTQF